MKNRHSFSLTIFASKARTMLFELFRLWLLSAFSDIQKSSENARFLTINTTSGPVRGNLMSTVVDKMPFYSFRGIPYAEPPTNGKRFLPPIPIRPWRSIRNCFMFGSVCMQFNPLNKSQLIGNEDCLFLNVYTPAAQIDQRIPLKPVMVYIHGGGFFFGSGNDDLQGPDLLIDEGVLLVTMNYRIGVLGFMSLGTSEYSGNQGLKDQQLALTWIHANIHNFGGDPNRVTIFGQSAGSASCVFHMIAPASRGLFQQSIQMSSTFDVWSIFQRGSHFDDMYQLAIDLNYKINNYNDLVGFLQNVDPVKLVISFPIVQFHPDRSPITISSKWLPMVENSDALQPFLQLKPSQIMAMDSFDLSVRVMMGYTTAESIFYNTPDCLQPELLDSFNNRFAIELPSINFDRDYDSPAYRRAASQIRNHYFPNQIAVNANNDTIKSFVQLMSNVYQNYPIDRRARLLAKQSRGSVFFYRFGLISALNYYKNTLGAQHQFGASHADDLCYVFHCSLIKEAYQLGVKSDEYRHFKAMSRLYANFARDSNPMLGKLSPVTENELHFVDITNGKLMVGVNPLADDMQFWTKTITEYEMMV